MINKTTGYSAFFVLLLSVLCAFAFFNNRICFRTASFTSDFDYVLLAYNAHNDHIGSKRSGVTIVDSVHTVNQRGKFTKAYRVSSRGRPISGEREEILVIVGGDSWLWGYGRSKKVTVLGKNDAYMSYFSACGAFYVTTR